ncbi:hypothetical protein D3C78_1819850 [compost metagenome]
MGDQFPHHPLGLVIFIVGRDHLQLFAVAQFGEQAFFKDVRVVGNQDIGGLQNTFAGTVVLLKLDHLQRRKIFL